MYERFFTFGCSYTSYNWPTWADIIIKNERYNGNEGYNFGLSGAGNVAIQTMILQADIKYQFTEKDCILVQWSSFDREDRLQNGVWNKGGTVFNCRYYDKKFIKKYWDKTNDLVKNYNAIIGANKTYKNLINIKIGLFADAEIDYFDNVENDQKVSLINNFYKKELPEFLYFDGYSGYVNLKDSHPCVMSHLSFSKKIIEKYNLSKIDDYILDELKETDKALRKKKGSIYKLNNIYASRKIEGNVWDEH